MPDGPEHLRATQFKAGHAPTPGAGRPRRRPLSDRYLEMLESPFPPALFRKLGLRLGSTWAEALVETHFRAALRTTEAGNAARKELREAIEGKATQRHEVHLDAEVEFVVSYAPPLPQLEEKAIDVTALPPSETADESEE